MKLIPLPHYFIIKIDIEKQKQRKEKIGSGILYSHVNEVFMTRNMQYGSIVAIGSQVAKQFTNAKIGDTLITHHFVEKEGTSNSNFIYSDGYFNFYNVTSSEVNGHRNESYGLWDGEKIIPHPDFIFVESEENIKKVSPEEFIEKNTKKVGNLILFNNWEEKREDKEEKAKNILSEIKNQSKGTSMKDDVKIALEEKQNEASKLTESLNKRKYLPFKLVAFNSSFQKQFNKIIKKDDTVYALNIASLTSIEFMDKTYIVIATKYISAVA